MTLVRIPVVRNQKYQPHGLKSYVYMLNRYGIHPTKPGPYRRTGGDKGLQKVLADGTSGAVTADDQQNDSFYTCAVQIGSPAQTVNLDFDSGSSDLWVKSTELSSSVVQQAQQAGVALFNPTASSSFQEINGATWQISYGDGSSASGTVGTDTLVLGGITVEQQAIEVATTISSSFTSESSSGLLGLAWGSINTVKPTPVKTPVENMIAQKDIPSSDELFTVCLGSVKNQGDADSNESFYTFGAIDQALVERSGQQISYTPCDNSQGFWMYDSSSMTINGQTIQRSGNMSILDTGTTLALVGDDVLEQIYGAIEGAQYDNTQQGWLIPTNTTSLPDITFAIGDTQFTFGKEALIWSQVNDTMSYGAIQSRGSLTFDIMGDAMLINLYAIFDVGNQRIGCVQRPTSSTNTGTGTTNNDTAGSSY